MIIGATVKDLNDLVSEMKSEVRDIQNQIAESNSLEELKELSKLLIGTIQNIEHYKIEMELIKKSSSEETLSLHDIDRSSAYKYINKQVKLTRDIFSWNNERVLKRKGAEGTLISLHTRYNQAIIKIGKRNYDISFSDFEVIL
jgi:hypothetical protein